MPDIVPQSLHTFYSECNPVDVEIDTEKYGAIRFYGVDELERIREEYYFYPKDDTPGCTKQACGFRNEYNKFKELNTIIIGISKDNSLSHAKFIAKYNLPFILLSDESHKVMEEYGVWQEKKLYGKTYMGVVRSSFLIDENGYIINKKLKVKPDTNALEIINLLEK